MTGHDEMTGIMTHDADRMHIGRVSSYDARQ